MYDMLVLKLWEDAMISFIKFQEVRMNHIAEGKSIEQCMEDVTVALKAVVDYAER